MFVNMPINHSLDGIWQAYKTTLDCLKIAKRSIAKNDPCLLAKTNFMGAVKDEAEQQIEQSWANADDYVILSLWTAFERILLVYVQEENQRMLTETATCFTHSIQQKIADDTEYWRIDDVLDFFKTAISSDLIGQAKQVKRYRDWVAHRNEKKATPANVTPKMAYDILTEIIRQLTEHEYFQYGNP